MRCEQVQYVDQAITCRQSIRAFLNKAIDIEVNKDILEVASRAPSGTNTQPWKGYVVMSQRRTELITQLSNAPIDLFKIIDLHLNILKAGSHHILNVNVKIAGDLMVY